LGKEAVLAALKRAAEDVDFYSQLAEDYTAALRGYDLTSEEAMRIGTGDLRWIQSYIGAKVDEQIVDKVFIPLLSREVYEP